MNNPLNRLDAYRISRAFLIRLDEALVEAPRGKDATQAKNAAASVMRNIGEATATTGADKARRFQIALNEAREATACLDILACRGALGGTRLTELLELNDRQCAMLWRLSRRR